MTFQCRAIGILMSICLVSIFVDSTIAEDWTRFRGANAAGMSTKAAPVEWSPKKNIKWNVELPGAGVSCPIVIGDKVVVTCYSGYGIERRKPGDIKDLKRHVVCLERESGKILWNRTIKNEAEEDRYSGMGVPEHGYASNTPVSDGKAIYAFLGKSGMYAYDLDGKELWHTSLGTESDDRRWGSASSPILHKDMVIVPAICEAGALVALKKEDGSEVWKQEAGGLRGSWSTPLITKVDDERSDLVMGVSNEVWGLNPDNGKLRWFLPVEGSSFFTSMMEKEGVIYGAIGGRRGGGSFAVKAGGDDDVSKTHKVWDSPDQSSYASPVVHNDMMFFVSGGVVNAIDAKTGERVKRARLKAPAAESEASDEDNEGGRTRRRRGGGRSSDYSSPVIAGDNMYYVKRNGEMHIISTDKELKQIAVNFVTKESEEFSATPAISDGQIFIRSNKRLYCVEEAKK